MLYPLSYEGTRADRKFRASTPHCVVDTSSSASCAVSISTSVRPSPRLLASYGNRRCGGLGPVERDRSTTQGEQRRFHEHGCETQRARPVADVLVVEGCADEAREGVPGEHGGADESRGRPGTRVVRDHEPRRDKHRGHDERDIAEAEQWRLLDRGDDLQEVNGSDGEECDHAGGTQDLRVGDVMVRLTHVRPLEVAAGHEISLVTRRVDVCPEGDTSPGYADHSVAARGPCAQTGRASLTSI